MHQILSKPCLLGLEGKISFSFRRNRAPATGTKFALAYASISMGDLKCCILEAGE